MSECERFSMQAADRQSVYALTDSQLAEEYRRLTGHAVQVPSRGSPSTWWSWRRELQLRVMQKRLQTQRQPPSP